MIIRKVQKGKTPTLLEADKANELIEKINALLNMEVVRQGDTDKFEVSSTNSLLTLSEHNKSTGGADLDGWDTLENVYFCIDGEASPRHILVKTPSYLS